MEGKWTTPFSESGRAKHCRTVLQERGGGQEWAVCMAFSQLSPFLFPSLFSVAPFVPGMEMSSNLTVRTGAGILTTGYPDEKYSLRLFRVEGTYERVCRVSHLLCDI